MKVLFIGSHRFDYLQDLIYSGLVKILGLQNVYEYEWISRYHFNHKAYPKNLGYQSGTLISSLLRSKSKTYDLVVVASSKPDCFQQYLKVIKDIPPTTPIIFLDGGDREEIGGDLKRLNAYHLYEEAVNHRPFDHIFKREYLKGKGYESHISPLPFCFNFDRLPKLGKNKKYDVSFWAVESHKIRSQALELLQDQFDCKSNGTVLNQEFKKYKRKGDHYFQELAACKVILNFRGGGWDTLRYWEVPAIGGFMISQPIDIVIPNDFRHEQEIVHCQEDLSDLLDLCQYYLKHEGEREKIAQQSQQHAQQYHTDQARAKYMLEKMKK